MITKLTYISFMHIKLDISYFLNRNLSKNEIISIIENLIDPYSEIDSKFKCNEFLDIDGNLEIKTSAKSPNSVLAIVLMIENELSKQLKIAS